jgi:hypothetical protein
MTNRHIRNPIKHHGYKPTKNFGMLAQDLIRDGKISSDAFRVYALLVSHESGYQESGESIAARYGWGQARTERAMKRLQDERLLVVQRYLTVRGTRAYETYHVPRSRRFTAAEVTEYGKTVTLGSPKTGNGGDPNRVEGVTQNGSGGLPETGKGGDPNRVTTEYQLENQLEDHLQKTNLEDGTHPDPWATSVPAVPGKNLEIERLDTDQECSPSPLPGSKKMPGAEESHDPAGNVTLIKPQDLEPDHVLLLLAYHESGHPLPDRYAHITFEDLMNLSEEHRVGSE